ncbi:MAG: Gfo/Idh/MocA family oxidoreductase, partial [Bacteroidota bacterium]
MKKIRYGIVGFGNFAERSILPAVRNSRNSELVAIQKRSADQAKSKAAEHGIPLYFTSVEEMIRSSDIDAVFIASANSQHH